jgi:hypothetical protein
MVLAARDKNYRRHAEGPRTASFGYLAEGSASSVNRFLYSPGPDRFIVDRWTFPLVVLISPL